MAAETTTPTVRSQVDFHWQHTGADWHLLLYLLLALGLAWWAQRRYGPAPTGWAGTVARACRILAILVTVLLLAGPSWRQTTITPIPGRILVAVDRSASMAREDGPGGAARIAIASDLARAVEGMAAERNLIIDWRSIGGVGDALDAATLAAAAATAPGASSPLGDELLRLADPGRCDHVILVSDGRVSTGSGLDLVAEHLREREISTSILGVGGETLDAALWIDQVVVNREAALGEREPILVRCTGRALDPESPLTVTASIDGREVATTQATAAGEDTTREFTATLVAEFLKEGEAILRIEAVSGDQRDVREMRITVTERRLQVLILDSRPRYELRYLREALRRDHTIELHAYLGTGRQWRRWSENGPEDHLPLTSLEVRDYDVIILGDVRPDQFTEDQLRAVEDSVRKHGTGLIWLLGETGATASFVKQPLGDLLPTRLGTADAIARGFLDQRPRRAARSKAAEAIGLFDPGDLDWSALPQLLGAAALGEPKPAAEILMQDQDDEPLVVARNYPPGRAIVVAVDDTWRWRRNVGDTYLQRFHGQLLRHASGGRQQGRHLWRLAPTPRRATAGDTITLALTPLGPPPEVLPDRVVAALVDGEGREVVVPLTATDGGFSAELPAPSAGSWRLRLVDGPEARLVDLGELEVQPPGAELRDPRADLEALDLLARSSGGRRYAEAQALVADLPDLGRDRVETLPPKGLWDTPWALAILVLLLAIEWSIRRWKRLP